MVVRAGKVEHWRIDPFKLWCWRRLLRVPCTARRLNLSILKEINPEYSFEGLMLKRKIWYFGHLMYSCLKNPMNSMKRQNDRILKEELPRSVDAQYATGDQWRNNSRKNEGMEPKQKQYPLEDVTGDRSKGRCCKEQYSIGTWNVRSKNQGKLERVKQEMARVNVDILGISKLKWTGMGEFNSDDHYIYYCGQESLRRNGVAIMVNKSV